MSSPKTFCRLAFRPLLALALFLSSNTNADVPDALTVRDHSNGLRSAFLSRPLRADSLIALDSGSAVFTTVTASPVLPIWQNICCCASPYRQRTTPKVKHRRCAIF